MLRAVNIYKKYHQTIVLDNITFNIPDNSFTGIIGPNGAGKSTILKIITGFENLNGGTIYFQDRKITSFNESRRLFAYMPEHLDIYSKYYIRVN